MAREGVRGNWGRIFGSVAAAIVAGACGGAIFLLFYIYLDGAILGFGVLDVFAGWFYIGAFSLILVIPSALLVGLPAAILIVAFRLDRWTGALVLLALASLPLFVVPLVMQTLLNATLWASDGFLPVASPFAYSAAFAMWLVLFRRRAKAHPLIQEEPVS